MFQGMTAQLHGETGSGLKFWRVRGGRARFILVLRECIWNAPAILLVLLTFDDTGSLGSLPHQVVYIPGSMVPPWVTASHFLAWNREADLKPTT